MDFEQREALIHEHFVKKMAVMYLPPNNAKQSDAAKKMYGEEIRRAINTRLSSDIPNTDVFNDLLAKVWDKCVAAHDFRIWFTPSLVAKQAGKVNGDYVAMQNKTNATWDRLSKPLKEGERSPTSKADPASQGWTIEKCDAAIEMTKKELGNSHMAKVLCRIPEKAKERLLNAGQTDTN
jgi:hypothetical protein